jgi:hypothetical protein
MSAYRGQKGFASVYMKKKNEDKRQETDSSSTRSLFPSWDCGRAVREKGRGCKGLPRMKMTKMTKKGGLNLLAGLFQLDQYSNCIHHPVNALLFLGDWKGKILSYHIFVCLVWITKETDYEAMSLILSFVLLFSSQLHQRSYHSLYRRLHFVGLQHKERPSLGPLSSSVSFLFSISADL